MGSAQSDPSIGMSLAFLHPALLYELVWEQGRQGLYFFLTLYSHLLNSSGSCACQSAGTANVGGFIPHPMHGYAGPFTVWPSFFTWSVSIWLDAENEICLSASVYHVNSTEFEESGPLVQINVFASQQHVANMPSAFSTEHKVYWVTLDIC